MRAYACALQQSPSSQSRLEDVLFWRMYQPPHRSRRMPLSLSSLRGGAGCIRRKGPQERVDRRLEEVAKAVGGGYCRLQMPLKLALGVRETVAGRRLGARGAPRSHAKGRTGDCPGPCKETATQQNVTQGVPPFPLQCTPRAGGGGGVADEGGPPRLVRRWRCGRRAATPSGYLSCPSRTTGSLRTGCPGAAPRRRRSGAPLTRGTRSTERWRRRMASGVFGPVARHSAGPLSSGLRCGWVSVCRGLWARPLQLLSNPLLQPLLKPPFSPPPPQAQPPGRRGGGGLWSGLPGASPGSRSTFSPGSHRWASPLLPSTSGW